MGIAFARYPLKNSEKTRDAWGIYGHDVLQNICADFESTILNDSAFGVYHAIRNLCGNYVVGRIVGDGKLSAPASGVPRLMSSVETSTTKRPAEGASTLQMLRDRVKRRRMEENVNFANYVNLDSSDIE